MPLTYIGGWQKGKNNLYWESHFPRSYLPLRTTRSSHTVMGRFVETLSTIARMALMIIAFSLFTAISDIGYGSKKILAVIFFSCVPLPLDFLSLCICLLVYLCHKDDPTHWKLRLPLTLRHPNHHLFTSSL